MDLSKLRVRVRAAEWNDRIYFNIESAKRSFRGDSTAKIWRRKGDDAIIFEPGKGTRSPEFAADLAAFLDFLKSEGIQVIKR